MPLIHNTPSDRKSLVVALMAMVLEMSYEDEALAS